MITTDGRAWTSWLYDQLPVSWYVPPLVGGMVPAMAAGPEWVVDYRIVLGGKWPAPEGGVLYGQRYPPHPLSLALWRAAQAAPGFLLVARTPTLAKGTRAVGERPEEVRRFDPATPQVALDWIVREAHRLHEEARPGTPYVSGKEHREKVKAAEVARFARAMEEAAARRKAEADAAAQVVKQQTAFTVRRGHRVPVKP